MAHPPHPPQPPQGRMRAVPVSQAGVRQRQMGAGSPLGAAVPPAQPPKKPKKKRSLWLRVLGFLFAAACIGFFAISAAVAYYVWDVTKDLPNYEVLAKYEPKVMTRIHANDGNLIAEFAQERRIYVPINAVPDRIIQAFLSAEDKNFFEHNGLDYMGIARAMLTNIKIVFLRVSNN